MRYDELRMQKRFQVLFIFLGVLVAGAAVWKAPSLWGSQWAQRQLADDGMFFRNIARSSTQLQQTDHIILAHKTGTDREGRSFIQFGNYVDMSSGKTLCALFDRIGLTLRSEGTAVNGYPVRASFEAPCPSVDSKDPLFILEVPLFDAEICDSQPDGVVHQVFPGAFLSLTNYDKEFPLDWVLEDVTFYSTQNRSQSIVFGEKDMRELLGGAPILLHCPASLY